MDKCLKTDQNNRPTLVVYFISAKRFKCNENKMFNEHNTDFPEETGIFNLFWKMDERY